jgi:hypothetical protein
MKTEIVIARYKEDLSWLKKIPKSIKITVYNKGLDDINYPSIKLPNIGRESHTYLYHIITNYNNLADQTIFCQGDSIFHSPGFIDLIKNRKKFQPIQPLSAFYWPEGIKPFLFYNPPLPVLNATKNLWINNNPIHVEYLNSEFITCYPFTYYQNHFIKLIELMKKLYNTKNILQFFINKFNLKNIDTNDLFPVSYAGLFSVNKNVILDNSIDFYNNILSMLLYEVKYKNNKTPIDFGLFLEKLWLVIFNYKKYNSNYIHLYAKDYTIFNKNISIKKSSIKFKIKNMNCDIFIELNIDNNLYSIQISKTKIILKDNKNNKLVNYFITNNKLFQKEIKYWCDLLINITLDNNILECTANNLKLIYYKFPFSVKNIIHSKILYLTKNNTFKNLLLNK